MNTIFTKIINKEIPADILFESDRILAFRDINPQAPVHFLVIPKKQISTLNDIKDDDKNIIGEMVIIAKDLAEKEGIVFFLWGNSAQKKESLIDSRKHLVLKAPHPSPLSAYNGFFGCRHFSKSNTRQARISIW